MGHPQGGLKRPILVTPLMPSPSPNIFGLSTLIVPSLCTGTSHNSIPDGPSLCHYLGLGPAGNLPFTGWSFIRSLFQFCEPHVLPCSGPALSCLVYHGVPLTRSVSVYLASADSLSARPLPLVVDFSSSALILPTLHEGLICLAYRLLGLRSSGVLLSLGYVYPR